jgi:hypothetical protein
MCMHISELTRACATKAEVWAAGNVKKVLVGIGCFNDPNPAGELMSWGVSGSGTADLMLAEAVEGIRIVDVNGATLWQRDPFDEPTGLREVIVHTPERVIDDAGERGWLHERTGAHIFDLESGILARTRRLRRIVRVISDRPHSPLHLAASFARRSGGVDAAMLGWAMKTDPIGTSVQLAKLSRVIYSLSRLSFQ